MANAVKDRSFIGLASVAGGLVVLYVMSPPFVAWTCMKLGVNDPGPVFMKFYAPLVMLYEHFPPYKMLMETLFKVLLP